MQFTVEVHFHTFIMMHHIHQNDNRTRTEHVNVRKTGAALRCRSAPRRQRRWPRFRVRLHKAGSHADVVRMCKLHLGWKLINARLDAFS